MTSKTKNRLKWIPSAIAAMMITASAVAKLTGAPPLVQAFTETGILRLLRPCAIAELLFITMFLLPGTMQVGILLLTAWYGGAIAIEVVNNGMPVAPALILGFIWIGAFLRNASIFIKQKITNTLNIA